MSAVPTVSALEHPLTDAYMLLPIEDGFNWDACFEGVQAGEWYLVVFRCKHAADADEDLLTRLDADAAAAARATPGLFFYFAGDPRATGECLSFCLWDSQTSARAGAMHAAHRKAIELGVKSYEYYTLERYLVQKSPDRLSFLRLEGLGQPTRQPVVGAFSHHATGTLITP